MTAADATPASGDHDPWLPMALLAVDPFGLGGAILAGPPSAARDAWLEGFLATLQPGAPVKRLPPFIEDDRLIGGLDLGATLNLKRPVIQRGLLAEADGGLLVIPSAERLDPATAARIGGAMAHGAIMLERDGATQRFDTRFALVAFDERVEPTEPFPAALDARCAFRIGLSHLLAGGLDIDAQSIAQARTRLPHVAAPSHDIVAALVRLALSLGIEALTPVQQALRAAAAHAALEGRLNISNEDAAVAARLILAPRATMAPVDDEEQVEEQRPERDRDNESRDDPGDSNTAPLDDVLRESAMTALPPGLLEQSAPRGARQTPTRAGGAGGGVRKSPLRGRPLGARPGQMRPGSRLALVDTLRTAAPWQAIRKRDRPEASERIEVRRGDFRIRRFAERREASIVFCVDASGSSAFHRMAEAKGAVELLLAEAYIARTHAALVAFRGTTADIVLPPTRSLARAHALLADMPGGGGTPLAIGLDAALQLALSERARGRDPMIVALTDGSANIARDGKAERLRATADALESAARIAGENVPSVFIDTAPRPRPECAALASAMAARLVPLPHVAAGAVAAAVRDVAGGR